MAISITKQLVEELRDSGVQRIYGLVGDSLNPIADAIRRTEGIEWVHVHNDEAAAFAASAEARLTGLATRIVAKITAYTDAFVVNRRLGRPQRRIKELWA